MQDLSLAVEMTNQSQNDFSRSLRLEMTKHNDKFLPKRNNRLELTR